MVARRLEYESLFAYHFKFPPREVDRMTVAEFMRHCVYADQIQEAMS